VPIAALIAAAHPIDGGQRTSKATINPLSAPIYDTEGNLLASLELDRSDSSQRSLRALIDVAARAIAERWFRIRHRVPWIVAALRLSAPDTSLILATCVLPGASRSLRRSRAIHGQ